MGGLILIFIMVLLIGILVMPALRARLRRDAPPPAPEDDPHEVVVHKLDDHRGKKKSGDDAQKS